MKSKTATREYKQTARAQAAKDTARRIVDAFLARLLAEWYDDITLDRIAADACVTVQTVVRRFGSKEQLLAVAVKSLAAQINAQRATTRASLAQIVDRLIADYEKTGDAVIRLLFLEARHPVLKEALDFGRAEHRRWVSETFSEMLNQLNNEGKKRASDALVVVTDVYVWKLLRRDMGNSRAATAATLRTLIQAVMTRFIPTNGPGDQA